MRFKCYRCDLSFDEGIAKIHTQITNNPISEVHEN